jgi:hypothetical protein
VDKNFEVWLTGPVNHGALFKVICFAWKPVRSDARRVFAFRTALRRTRRWPVCLAVMRTWPAEKLAAQRERAKTPL